MSDAEQTDLADRLYAVHQRIFSGVSRERFLSHVVAPPAASTIIQLYSASDDTIAGYCAIHRFSRRIRGRAAIVMRAEAGLVPEYRGHAATHNFGMMRAARAKLRHPFTPIYYLGTLVHPSSYHLICKYFPRLFPHPVREAPDEVKAIAHELIDSFPDAAVTEDDPFLRDVGWVTIETPRERALHQGDKRRDVQFFKVRNPGYARGHGLVVFVEMTFANIARALLIRLREGAGVRLGGTRQAF